MFLFFNKKKINITFACFFFIYPGDNLKEKKIVDEIHSKVDDSNTKSTNKIVFDASKESNSVDYSMCQIKRNVNEMFNRIELFCTNKKQRASAIKLQENCIYRYRSKKIFHQTHIMI